MATNANGAGVRYLSGDDPIAERMPSGGLRVIIGEDETHDYVRAYRSRPFSQPNQFISLRIGKSSETEIGIVRDLEALHPIARKLIEEELAKRYLVHAVTKIHRIEEEMGFLYWDVDTSLGRRQFTTPRWRQSHVAELGENSQGRLILDVVLNRFVIPDLAQLDPVSRKLFHRYIYW